MKKCALTLVLLLIAAGVARALPSLSWKGTMTFSNGTLSVAPSVPVGQTGNVGDEFIVFLGLNAQGVTVTPPATSGVTWSTYATSCGPAGGGEEVCAFTGQITSTQAASTSYTFTAATAHIAAADIWDVAGTTNAVDYIHIAQGTSGGTSLTMTPTLTAANDFVAGMMLNFNAVNFGTISYAGGWTGTPTTANTLFSAGSGMAADFYNVQTATGSPSLTVNWTTSTWADYVVVALKSGAGGGPINIFNCTSGFTHATTPVACGVSLYGESGGLFDVLGSNNGATPVMAGSAVNLIPNGGTHVALSLIYQTLVNIQGFSTTFTFVPNGQNLVFMIENSNNNPGFNGSQFSAGAGCEADFFQGFGQAAPPNNLFVLELDSYSPLTAAGSFTYSSAQIYPAGYSPCNPDLGGTNFTYVSTTKLSTSPVALNSPAASQGTTTGHTYSATVTYDGTNFTLNLFDVTAAGSCPGASCYSQTWNVMPQGGGGVGIPSFVGGNTAWIGFGAATGSASTADLLIKSWSYTVNPTSTGSSSLSGFFYAP